MDNEDRLREEYFSDVQFTFLKNGKSEEEIKKEIEELIEERNKLFLENGIEIPYEMNNEINSKK